jgi:hypothetical protein
MFSASLKYKLLTWAVACVAMMSPRAHGQSPDSTRFSVSFSVGSSLPLAGFRQSGSDGLVALVPRDPLPPSARFRHYQRKGQAAALPGTVLAINFSYRLAPRWNFLCDVGVAHHRVDTAPAEEFWRQNVPLANFSELQVSASDYRCLSLATSLAYRHSFGRGWLQAGPVLGLAVLTYPDYAVRAQALSRSIQWEFTHWGAEPNLTGLLAGGIAEFTFPWRLVAKKSQQTVARMELGVRLTYVMSEFTYYATVGTDPQISDYYRDEINYRVLQPTLRLGVKLD